MFIRFASILAGILILHGNAADGAIYFAAEQPPPPNSAPVEAPLCYKFQDTVSLEEQLGKLKAKYGTALYDEKIVKNEDGSRSLLAKKKDEESGLTMEYFYSDSSTACNEYKKQSTLDECFALKSVFGTCDVEYKYSTWIPDRKHTDEDGKPISFTSEIIGSKDFIQLGTKKNMVLFKSSSSEACGQACSETVDAAIFSKKEKVWKLDIFDKGLSVIYTFAGSSSISLKFKQLGRYGITAIVEEVDPSIEMSLDKPLYAYTTTTKIIGVANNELHELLSMVTAEEYFHPNQIPYKWTSDIKCADEAENCYDIAIHSYGINGTGRYFDRTRGYAICEGKLREVWRDDEKEVDKKDKDIGTLCQTVDAIGETPNSYFLKNTCALFKKGEIGEDFPLKSTILEEICFVHYKQFPQASINKLCSSYDYNAAIRKYSLLSDSELRNKLKINIVPANTLCYDGSVISLEEVLPAYFDHHKKQVMTEGGYSELEKLKEDDKDNINSSSDSARDDILDAFGLKNKDISFCSDGADDNDNGSSNVYLIIGDEPEKHIRMLKSTYLSSSKEMPACFSAKGEQWKLKDSAIYSVQGLKRKIYSVILTNSSSGKTVNRIVSADDKGNCAKLFESREYIREEESNSEPPFTIPNMLTLETVIEIKDGNKVENWLVFRDRTGLAVRYHENDSTVFSLANKKDYEYSSWIR